MYCYLLLNEITSIGIGGSPNPKCLQHRDRCQPPVTVFSRARLIWNFFAADADNDIREYKIHDTDTLVDINIYVCVCVCIFFTSVNDS